MASRRLEGALYGGLFVDWAEIAAGCAVASAVGLAVNVALLGWERWAAARPKQPTPWMFERLDGTRNGQYLVCMAFQLLVPPLFVWSLLRRSRDASGHAGSASSAVAPAWLRREGGFFPEQEPGGDVHGENSSLLPLRLFLYAFFGHLIRDTAMELGMASYNPKFLAHHALCIVATFWALLAQEATVPIATGIASCEVGSFFWNVWVLDSANRPRPEWRVPWPRCERCHGGKVVLWLYIVVFTGSNVLAAVMLFHASQIAAQAGHVWLAACYAVSGTVLLLLRQLEVGQFLCGNFVLPKYDDDAEAYNDLDAEQAKARTSLDVSIDSRAARMSDAGDELAPALAASK